MSTYRVVVLEDENNYPVHPDHIDASKHLADAFDNIETEISAGWIVRFMQERGEGWKPFTYEDINGFYSRSFPNGFSFNRLVNPEMVPPILVRAFAGHNDPKVPVGGGWIMLGEDKKYRVTNDFVNRCFDSSPAPETTVS